MFTYNQETVEAVYCEDFYAEQLEAERNGTWSSKEFT
eukprot:CAMPEP_0185591164 /NCGR_PEP_ID=MMETSP0434-20130131/63610_1 /TAXON_ID=626734 ORGANISM="Favella taraikaensis, Strain Fe Narragansett Bay" /NCGR_SAMPLE_ID=MMETSP0434 /ASSEMBLY_ACC=CAM_ASM_000379 /LENGTH=36 /DNA_ID= /DNA_START= /DNA_END= /DNA_ORIENTATION=